MAKHGSKWRSVLAYALMSNGRAERMVGTLKRAIGKLVSSNSLWWDFAVEEAVFGYCRRPLQNGCSPFELLYGVKTKILPVDREVGRSVQDEGFREIELLGTLSIRGNRAVQNERPSFKGKKAVERFQAGDVVQVAHGSAFVAVKWPPFRSKFYRPCVITNANHPRYELKSSTGLRSRTEIHAHRLVRYYPRGN